MRSYNESKISDEENLIIISQIPVAMKVIENLLASREELKISDLPFQLKAAETYAALFTHNHPEMKYDDDEEVITRKCRVAQTAT